MNKLLWFLVLCLVSSFPVTAQCDLEASKLPALRGLKLGMTQKELAATYPFLPMSEPIYKNWGVTDFGTKPAFENVQFVEAEFDKAGLRRFGVTYISMPVEVSEFAAHIGEALGVPKDSYFYKGGSDSCKDFHIQIRRSTVTLQRLEPKVPSKPFKP